MAQAETNITTNPFADMTMRQLHVVYDSIQAAMAGLQGILNEPRTIMDGTAASNWIENEIEKFEGIVENQVIPLVLARSPGGEGRERQRLSILCDYASRCEDRDLDREVVAGLLRRIEGRQRTETVADRPIVSPASAASGFDRTATASKAHDAVDLARSLVLALRGTEEGLEGVGSGKDGPHPSDRVVVDLMSLGALAGVVADQMNEVALDLHG